LSVAKKKELSLGSGPRGEWNIGRKTKTTPHHHLEGEKTTNFIGTWLGPEKRRVWPNTRGLRGVSKERSKHVRRRKERMVGEENGGRRMTLDRR